MNCPQCDQPMENLGNIAGTMMTSIPPKWYDTHVCHACKVRADKLVTGSSLPKLPDLSDYKKIVMIRSEDI